MEDIVVSVAAKVAECLVAPVGRHCGYVIFPDSYVRQLEEEREKLENERRRVQHLIDEARNNMKPIEAVVEKWVTDVETITNKARDVLENRRAKKTCLYGWLPNPKARYRLGREARTTVQAIQKLIQEGRFERVFYESAPPGLVVGASSVHSSAGDGGNTITNSRASIFRGIMKALDDEKLKVIGVYGPAGVGKTTLLKEVEKKLRKAGRPFHMIVKVEVSQIPDLNNIRDQITDALSLDLKDKQSPQGKRDALSERLKRDPNETFLIIFDNLWEKVDLEAVGIPWGDVSSKCKLLLTSRFKDVLEQEMGADRTFPLRGLTDGEASRLFKNKVGDKLKDNEELKSIADQVVKKLAGLPLLIISVANTLKSGDESAWRNALIEIDESNKEKTETIVKLSYDHLKSEDAKLLFLLCGLIGGTIQVELLFVLAMGLGLFQRFNKTIQTSRDRLNNMLNELRSACLLLDGDNDKDNVTIHDLYSEVVVSDAFGGQDSLMINNNYGSWPKEKLEKCWACMVNVGSNRLVELMLRRYPHVKILMLLEQYDRGDCSKMDFTYMGELRALYLCSMRITSLPLSMEILGNLQSLSIHCHVNDVANLGKLKALQILSFAGSTIYRLPKEMGELTNLRLLNLSNCRSLERIEPGVLKCLIKLEELHMKGSFNQWMGKIEKPSKLCNAELAELRSMTKLNSLEISILDPIRLLEVDDLPFENLTRFWISIGDVKEKKFVMHGFEVREFKDLRTMKIKLEGQDSILSKTWVQKTLQKTQYLHLDGLREFKNAHELCIRGFSQLKHLNIQNSQSIKYIASSSNSAFTILESLFLYNLFDLEKICHRHITTACLSKLKDVRVSHCSRLKYLWCLLQMQNLVQLENIKVWECGSMRAIARKDIVSTNYSVELPYLRCLDLNMSPNMTSLCTGAEITSEGAPIQARVVVGGGGGDEGTKSVTTTSDLQNIYSDSFFDGKIKLPNLKDLKLNSVGSFKRIWHDELFRSSFCKLATITVASCSDLLHIFPSTIIGRLHNLQSVKVKNCQSLKSLFDFGSLDSDMEQNTVLFPKLVRIDVESCLSLELLFDCGSLDSNAEHKIITFPKLEIVSVSGAKKLRHIVMSHSQIVLGFPSLKIVNVENCSDLRYLFSKCLATTLMKLDRLTISECEQMKEVILEKKASRLKAEVMTFPCLSTLTLKKLDNLISFGSGSCSYYFSSLEDLRIVWCRNFGAFISSSTSVKRQLGEMVEENDESSQPLFNEMVTFPNIRSMKISGLQCKELWNNQIPTDSFQKLESLKLNKCDNLQCIATSYMWKKLQCCLKELEVISCRLIEIIYEGDGTDTESGKLIWLGMSDLKNLRCIWQSNSLPNIPFPNLRYVEAVRCPRLEMLFPTFTVKFLGQIKELVVESCENMELIAGHEKWEEATDTTITFSELTALKLFELSKFKTFLPEKYSLTFPSLRVLSIKSCGAEPDQVLGDWLSHELERRFRLSRNEDSACHIL